MRAWRRRLGRGSRACAALLLVARLAVADPPAGWNSQKAYDASTAAEDARRAGLWDACAEADRASLAAEDRLPTRVHLVGCLDRAGHVLAALREMQTVLDLALSTKDPDLGNLARERVEQLLRELARVRIEPPPPDVHDLVVTWDGARLDAAALEPGKSFPVDPGKHRVHAEATFQGAPIAYDDVVDAAAGQTLAVAVTLKPRSPEFLTTGQMACMQTAKNQDEVLRCLPGKEKPLVARIGVDYSTYEDTLAVRVVSPAIHGQLWSPTKGWNVGGGYVLDVVSAASPDFVSSASRRGHDTRQAGSLSAGYKPGAYGVQAGGAYSTEADYVSRSGYLAVLGDFADKRVTPRLEYAYTNDTIGRGGTPFSVFSNTLLSNEGALGVTFVMGPRTVLVAGGSATFERGDQSKPYRLIPMFAPGVSVPAGASTDTVNALRLPMRPYEQLPLSRDRYAAGARIAHRFSGSTLRLEERLYADSWELSGTTTDLRFLVDVGSRLTMGPHLHFNAQTGAVFYHRVYNATTSPIAVPVFRTTDRELEPLLSGTGGASLRWELAPESASVHEAVLLSGDVMYTRYLDALYITERIAGYGTIGFEVQFE